MTPKIADRMKTLVLEQDRVQMQKTIDTLRYELSQRHTMTEEYAELVREKNILEDLLVSTQSENERCEEELKKWKAYAKERTGVPATPAAIKAFRKPIGGKNGASRHNCLHPPDQFSNDPSEAPAAESSEATSTIFSEIASQIYHSAASQHVVTARDLRTGAGGGKYGPETPQPRRRGIARIGTPPKPTAKRTMNYEEQVVPALANASKREERRRSLLMDGASLRSGWMNMGLKGFDGKEAKRSDSPEKLHEERSHQGGGTSDTTLPDLGSIENLISQSPSTEEHRKSDISENGSKFGIDFLATRGTGRHRGGTQNRRKKSLRMHEADDLALAKAAESNADSETASVDSWYDENEVGWFEDDDAKVEDFVERLSYSSPGEGQKQHLACETIDSRSMEDPRQVAIVLKDFHIRLQGSASALEAAVEQIRNSQRAGQSHEMRLMRSQGEKRAEAIQQISDMADDVKSHLAEMELQADEREKRLAEMLETALAHVELYSPPPATAISAGVDREPSSSTQSPPARITT
ncbi:hypothetical protein NliqN6_2726 [Naganishia liquefaciens]|uniref:Uncharacterized protein n=1 Tax=Naganishia liquefaciens TaxID=104408 RepID=A0A8H3TSP9_9TREE|nr:hypothetical protein NliqN6_2726 [Naganishia liquefaciens]